MTSNQPTLTSKWRWNRERPVTERTRRPRLLRGSSATWLSFVRSTMRESPYAPTLRGMHTPPLAYLYQKNNNKHVFILVLGPARRPKLTMRCKGVARRGEQVECKAGERDVKAHANGRKLIRINSLEKMEADFKRCVPLHLLLLPLHFTYLLY